ncbi:HAMP domain-containing sensor histidine kinase [Chitinolyticbacter albus]|uniref:HAMP domain-containing sensor histidine kinase n=1 Tax=Chitinolyticbacter albus TaxID=2961951 RepID=UPI00210E095D|nr:HAMP domain-containing sensor histidine kinase [Chitinolyticbacter albus]
MSGAAELWRRWRRFASSPFNRFVLILPMFMLVATGGFVLLTYHESHRALLGEFHAALSEEENNLELVYRQQGLGALREEIARRASRSDALYLLVAPDGTSLAGNLAHWPDGVPTTSARSISFADPGDGSTVAAEVFLLYGNYRLLVGRRAIYEQVGIHLLRNYLALSAIVLTASLVCGWIFTTLLRRRLGTITQTARAIRGEAGHTRIPGGKSGDEIDALIDELNAMLEQQDKLLGYARQSSFAIAHDLRHPLSDLRNGLSDLGHGLKGGPLADQVDALTGNVDRILAVFSALLRLGRLESGAQQLQRQAWPLDELVDDVVSLYQPLAEDAGRVLRLTTVPCTTEVDRELLGQALANLIENALRYGAGRIEVGVAIESRHIALSVRDYGAGLTEDEMLRVTEPFVRLESSRHTPGSGLGLTLVKAIAEAHGGELVLTPAEPGLRVTIRLPRSGLTPDA